MGAQGWVYNPVNNVAANYLSFQDAADTPVSSPLAVDTTTIKQLVVPDRAVKVTISGTVDVRIGTDSSLSSYFVVPANTPVVLPVATVDSLYVLGDSASGDCHFVFHML